MLKARDKLGDYEIVARLKAGGMAQLYLARKKGAAGFARPVALKVIHPHLASEPSFVRMFIDEATLSAKIEAPNVVKTEELGEIGGTWFHAMEYVHGTSLAQALAAVRSRGRRLSPELAVHVAAEIAAGLHAAHETTEATGAPLGIVHRDVSPQNVLLSYRGHVKVIDFGIAKVKRRLGGTTGDAIVGKLAYMPPEQARGEEVDRRADVYALGVVLWEMLVLERLFAAPNEIALLEQVRHPRVVAPGARAPGVPRALDEVVLRALAPRPEDRPASAAELRKMLLDAVPAAREVEAEHVAALLAATMSTQIAKQAQLLPLVSESTVRIEATPTPPEHAEDVFRQLTLPAVVVPASAPAVEAQARPRSAWLVPVMAGLAAIVMVSAAVAFAMRTRGFAAEASAAEASASAAAEPEPVASPEPAPPPVATVGFEVVTTPEASSPVASASASASTRAAPPPRRTHAPRARPRPAPPAAATAKTTCRTIGGVELCE